MTGYRVAEKDIAAYRDKVIPYWQGRSMRERIFSEVPEEWKAAYETGLFTEFMEQRAPGHTALDGAIYEQGMRDYKRRIQKRIAGLNYLDDPRASDRYEQLKAMDIACDAAIIFAERHADLAEELAGWRRAVALFRAWEMIGRARLRLLENNLGLAATDIELAIVALDDLIEGESDQPSEDLIPIRERLVLAGVSLPDQPAATARDLETAWEALDAIVAEAVGQGSASE